MHAVRLAIVTVICAGLIYAQGRVVYLGLSTGRIVYRRQRLHCERATHPVAFWLLVVLNLGLVLALAAVWLRFARP